MLLGFIGPTEIVVILVIALLVFGPNKLPEVGKQIGSAYRELNKMRNDVQKVLDIDVYGNNHYDHTYDSPTYGGDSNYGTTYPHDASASSYVHTTDTPALDAADSVNHANSTAFVAPPGPLGAQTNLNLDNVKSSENGVAVSVPAPASADVVHPIETTEHLEQPARVGQEA